MKKFIGLFTVLLFSITFLFSQEALKSLEEDYYDFISLRGITQKPTLGYRTLSDNIWNYNEISDFLENEDGSFSKVLIPGNESDINIWKNNNLGTRYTLWKTTNESNNFFARGVKQGLFVRIYGPEWYGSYNSQVPYGQNDGALWQGKGFNTSFTTGIRFEGYGFELTFKPQLSWSQNAEYTFPAGVVNPYNYWDSGVDLVQRYGDKSFFNFDAGDSEVRYTWHKFTFGFGTQSPWLGTAYLNPMLGSNNAAGYLKFDIGLRKTEIIIPFFNSKQINLGYIEGRIWTGQLKESSYFDNNPDNNKRMVNGLSASYSPSFIPGFTIGLNRIFMTYWRKDNLKYILRLFTLSRSNALSSSGNDEDQKFSIFAEWNFPKVGFTVYGEFGRDDFSFNEKTYPFHTAIYTVGAKQYIPLPFNLKSELIFEWNNFEMSQDFQLQWGYLGYYAHGFVNQGYTNNGQIIGAGTGTFGNSQLIQYTIYYPKGYTLLKFHRHSPNNNSILSKAVYTIADVNSDFYSQWYQNFETYFTFGIETGFFFTKDFFGKLGLNYSKIYCSNYVPGLSSNNSNINFNFMLKYDF